MKNDPKEANSLRSHYTVFEPEIDQSETIEPRLSKKRGRANDLTLKERQGAKSSGSKTKRTNYAKRTNDRGQVSRPNSYPQRVVVKARVVKHSQEKGASKLKAHIIYLARSGVGQNRKSVNFNTKQGSVRVSELRSVANELGSIYLC